VLETARIEVADTSLMGREFVRGLHDQLREHHGLSGGHRKVTEDEQEQD
jgi:hypothetical protein